MRALTTLLIGFALALLVVGVALLPLLHPATTRLLTERYSLAREAGLPLPRMLQVAEQVRAFVADDGAQTLPLTVDGRAGFDASAVAHLADVRRVMSGARTFTGVLAALVAVWLGVQVARRRFDRIAPALFVGAVGCAAIVVLGVLVGTASFDLLFAKFHGLFFAAGSWEFPADSLLIQTFPEPFWSMAAAAWGGLVAAGGGLLAVAGVFVRRGLPRAGIGSPRDHSSTSA